MAENDAGNVAAMRKALEQASYFLHRHHMGAVYAPDGETLIYCWDVAKIVDDALAAPRRNCDVGTIEEQLQRFEAYCSAHEPCESCPLDRPRATPSCGVHWSQLPYEEGAGKC